ncbi:hypothetical protein H310_13315 [Aphanomyces invadans]|uniref:2Fe-2S ferredoxin n=1 Tax=Aphanomyces invadans TaxID=157072 RepID=A0A024TEI6_9STRA|nr:hypothetical protein H310_13315 [Aphanomyces invadans]ETV92438.1 hypothetical protein H310_13315 [Aphanomyces invadans]|eukprot:XP_008878989.1 hypothetical protein H310_13315 [Aphanomyces invadans]
MSFAPRLVRRLVGPHRPSSRRLFHATSLLQHGGSHVAANGPTVPLKFRLKDGSIKVVDAAIGASILDVAHKYDIDLEGACESSLACSTCHVIIEDDLFDKLPEPCEEEEDMLDLAFGLTATSRLGCQVMVSKDMENSVITLPLATRNFYVDGHVPKPH